MMRDYFVVRILVSRQCFREEGRSNEMCREKLKMFLFCLCDLLSSKNII